MLLFITGKSISTLNMEVISIIQQYVQVAESRWCVNHKTWMWDISSAVFDPVGLNASSIHFNCQMRRLNGFG